MLKDYEKDFAGGGAESHAYADFASALGHGIGHDAVDARDGEEESDKRKDDDEGKAKAAGVERGGVDLRKSVKARRHIRIELVKDAASGGDDGIRFRGSVQDDGETIGSHRALTIIDVNGGRSSGLQGMIVDVADNTNDCEEARIAIHVPEFDGAADGILIGPRLLGERLADESDMRGVDCVVFVEETALEKRNVESFKKARGNDKEISFAEVRLVTEEFIKKISEFSEQRVIFFKATGERALDQILNARGDLRGVHEDERTLGKTSIGERQVVGATDFIDARNLAETGEELIEESDAIRFRTIEGEPEVHGDDVFGAEPGVDGENAEEAAAEKSGADEKNESRSKLSGG